MSFYNMPSELFYIISNVFLIRHLFILCALSSVAGIAEGLEILNVE